MAVPKKTIAVPKRKKLVPKTPKLKVPKKVPKRVAIDKFGYHNSFLETEKYSVVTQVYKAFGFMGVIMNYFRLVQN